MKITHPLEAILHPQSVAVVGASDSPSGQGFGFVSPLVEFGFKGNIYTVNPKYSEILGMKTYSSLREISGSVDYVISCVPAAAVLDMLEDCPQKGVKAVQLYTARFSETGRPEAAELEQKILKRARELGIRLIGPNCMGLYYPEQVISFNDDFTKKSGSAGLASQSGNVASELIRLASLRGVYFSKAISYGNAIDFNECDYLDYFAQDSETKIIMMYIEGVKDGRRFFNSLLRATPTKPVIVLKGGRGKAGARAAASHTASLAGSMKTWEAVIAQAGAVSAENLDELIDLAVSFYFLPPIQGTRVGVVGGAGGASVLAADQCEEAGLDVIPLPAEIREELKSKGNPIWDWISNPVDISIGGGTNFNVSDMAKMMAQHPNSARAYVERYKPAENNQKPLLAVVADRSLGRDDYDDTSWKLSCEMRTELIAANIPFYPTIGRAARAARKLTDYYQRRG